MSGGFRIKKLRTQKGFGLVEIVIAGAIASTALIAVIGFFLFSQSVASRTIRNTEATALAEQATEAVRKLRDESWFSNIATLTVGTTYYPVLSANKWTLSASNPSPSSFYTTTAVVTNVFRDASSNIAASGSNDANTKKLTVTTSWKEGADTKTVVLTTYITNFLGN